VLGDLDEALIYIDGMPARRDVAVDAGEPSIGREAEFSRIDGRRLDIGAPGPDPRSALNAGLAAASNTQASANADL
jgi:hypothetical protein